VPTRRVLDARKYRIVTVTLEFFWKPGGGPLLNF